MKTLREINKLSTDWLKSRDVPEARLSVEILLAQVLKCRRIDLYMDPNRPLSEEELASFRTLLRRRGKHEPIAYILNEREFYAIPFYVDEAVLIPRPETEFLVDFALELINGPKQKPVNRSVELNLIDRQLSPDGESAEDAASDEEAESDSSAGEQQATNDSITAEAEPTEELPQRPVRTGPFWFADIGTGSGCIPISILKNCDSDVRAVAVDKSEAALDVASRNRDRHELNERLELLHGHLCEPLSGTGVKFDLIVSNPPYIPHADLKTLDRGVADFEPHLALFDDADDGLGLTRELIAQARNHLVKNGMIALECGASRVPGAQQVLEELGYTDFKIIRDYGRHERVICARFPG